MFTLSCADYEYFIASHFARYGAYRARIWHPFLPERFFTYLGDANWQRNERKQSIDLALTSRRVTKKRACLYDDTDYV